MLRALLSEIRSLTKAVRDYHGWAKNTWSKGSPLRAYPAVNAWWYRKRVIVHTIPDLGLILYHPGAADIWKSLILLPLHLIWETKAYIWLQANTLRAKKVFTVKYDRYPREWMRNIVAMPMVEEGERWSIIKDESEWDASHPRWGLENEWEIPNQRRG